MEQSKEIREMVKIKKADKVSTAKEKDRIGNTVPIVKELKLKPLNKIKAENIKPNTEPAIDK